METMTSSMKPSAVTIDLSASCNTMVVFLKDIWRLRLSMVSVVMTLISAPKLMRYWDCNVVYVYIPGYQDLDTLG